MPDPVRFLIVIFLCAGAAVTTKSVCNSGHEEEWSSSQNIGTGREATPYINVLIIVYAFLTGLHFDQLKVYIFLLDLKIYDIIY